MITFYQKTQDSSELTVSSEHRQHVWTHVVTPTHDDIGKLVSLYGVDESILEDIDDFFEVPRIEYDNSVVYCFTRYPYDVKDLDIDTAPILMVLGESFFITIAQQEVPFLDSFTRGVGEFNTHQRTKLFLAFMAALVQSYDKQLTRIRKMVYRDMGRVRSIRAREIQRLVFFEQQLNESISALVPTHVWLQHLTKGNYLHFFSEDREFLDDILIDNSQLIDSAKSILKTIQNIRGASDALLTQDLNSTLRMLAAFTIVLTIPTLVSSLFGMNVIVPFGNSPHAFLFIIVGILAAVAVTVYFFIRNKWI
jgi:magnesium transporter